MTSVVRRIGLAFGLIAVGGAGHAQRDPLAPLPDTGTELIQQLLGGVTNDLDSIDQRPCQQSMALEEYLERHAG